MERGNGFTRRDILKGAAFAALAMALPSCSSGASKTPTRAKTAQKAKPVTTRPDHISGVFLYWPHEMATYSPAQWDECLARLHKLGMDTLITQYSVTDGQAWYHSKHFPMVSAVDPTRRLLEAAVRAEFKIHLGTVSDDRWWSVPDHPEQIPGYIKEETARNTQLIGELVDQYHDLPSFAGIYLSHEIHLGQEGLQISEENLPALAEFCNRIGDYAKARAPRLAFSNAPFFGLQGTVEKFEAMWRRLLSQTHFDLLMFQDGVGCERHITVDNMVPYYAAMARACKASKVELWTDLELFDLNPPKIVSPERVTTQVEREAPYVSKIVAYSYANLTPEFAAQLPGVKK